MTFEAKALSDSAVVVLGQLFVFGPTCDGNLATKSGRDELAKAGLADKANGFNFLTKEGVQAASEWKAIGRSSYLDQCWHRKAERR